MKVDMLSSLNAALGPFGLEILRRKRTVSSLYNQGTHVLYRYENDNGEFDYQKYKAVQQKGNKEKLENCWVLESNIQFLSEYLLKFAPLKSGICHGTRRGLEQEWFRKYTGADVIGTEISETAAQFPHTIQWDFHEVKPEWLDKIDFIYSNSFDHSYDPEKCLNAWMSCLRPGGICILEHTDMHSTKGVSELDPFGVDLMAMPYLILTWGKGNYGVREILDAPAINDRVKYTKFLVLQKW